MHRNAAAVPLFLGWASLFVAAGLGMNESGFFAEETDEYLTSAASVHGLPAPMVVGLLIFAAFVVGPIFIMALQSKEPGDSVYWTGAAIGMSGLLLATGSLSFGVPLIAGGGLILYGGWLLAQPASGLAGPPAAFDAPPTANPTSGTSAASPEPTITPPTGRKGRRVKASDAVGCPWCSATVSRNDVVCPACQASLDRPDREPVDLPGLTRLDPELAAADANYEPPRAQGLLRTIFTADLEAMRMRRRSRDMAKAAEMAASEPSDTDALAPPSPELRREMARIDAEIKARAFSESAGTGEPGETAPTQPEP